MAEAKTFRAVVTAILALQGCGSKINQPELNRAAEAAYERAALIYSFDLTEPDKTRAMSIITEPLRDNRGNKADVLEIISYGLDFDDAGL